MRFIWLFLLTLFIGLENYRSQTYYPPLIGTWDTLAPDSLNYCQPEIDSLYAFLDSNNTKAFILLKDGRIVLEKYFSSFTIDSSWYWASAGKTLTASLIGIAESEGFLSVNDTSQNYLGNNWTTAPSLKEQAITIKNQLSMTTGLDDGVPNPDCTVDTCLLYLNDAGTRWAYHNAPYTLLDQVIQSATGSTLNQYLIQKLRNPIGMGGAFFNLGYNNVYFSKARSMARFGILLLSNGYWNNVSIVDSTFVHHMTTPSQSLNPSYGYLTWLNGQSSYLLPQSQFSFQGSINPDAPNDLYMAMGKNGQLINVVPSQGIVWIRMGQAPGSGSGLIAPIFNNDIWKMINQLSCIPSGLSENSVNNENVDISPNPSNSYCNVSSKQKIHEISIINVMGNVQKTIAVNAIQTELDVSDLRTGVYFLKVSWKNMEKVVIKRLIVNHHN